MVSKTKKRKYRFRRAYSLAEVMIASVVLVIAVIGTSGYRYYARLDSRRAAIQMTASRVGLLLCEGWQGVGGSNTFDPTLYSGPEMTISAGSGPAPPLNFTLLGKYKVAVNDTNCYATLSWQDSVPGLRAINVTVAWNPHQSQWEWVKDDSSTTEEYNLFKLSTYVAQ
jgi:hypothetical protein